MHLSVRKCFFYLGGGAARLSVGEPFVCSFLWVMNGSFFVDEMSGLPEWSGQIILICVT